MSFPKRKHIHFHSFHSYSAHLLHEYLFTAEEVPYVTSQLSHWNEKGKKDNKIITTSSCCTVQRIMLLMQTDFWWIYISREAGRGEKVRAKDTHTHTVRSGSEGFQLSQLIQSQHLHPCCWPSDINPTHCHQGFYGGNNPFFARKCNQYS